MSQFLLNIRSSFFPIFLKITLYFFKLIFLRKGTVTHQHLCPEKWLKQKYLNYLTTTILISIWLLIDCKNDNHTKKSWQITCNSLVMSILNLTHDPSLYTSGQHFPIKATLANKYVIFWFNVFYKSCSSVSLLSKYYKHLGSVWRGCRVTANLLNQ